MKSYWQLEMFSVSSTAMLACWQSLTLTNGPKLLDTVLVDMEDVVNPTLPGCCLIRSSTQAASVDWQTYILLGDGRRREAVVGVQEVDQDVHGSWEHEVSLACFWNSRPPVFRSNGHKNGYLSHSISHCFLFSSLSLSRSLSLSPCLVSFMWYLACWPGLLWRHSPAHGHL